MTMKWMVRKTMAVVAAYAIVLQGLLLGLAPVAGLGFDSFAVVCTADASAEHQPFLPQHKSVCDVCLAACSHASALVNSGGGLSTLIFISRPNHLILATDPPPLQSRHKPQAARAPPISS